MSRRTRIVFAAILLPVIMVATSVFIRGQELGEAVLYTAIGIAIAAILITGQAAWNRRRSAG